MTSAAAHHFGLRRAAWSIDAASHAVEVHAANLAASLAENGFHVLTLYGASTESLNNLGAFLRLRGVSLTLRDWSDLGFHTVDLENTRPIKPSHHEYAGAVVRERDAVTN